MYTWNTAGKVMTNCDSLGKWRESVKQMNKKGTSKGEKKYTKKQINELKYSEFRH